MYIYLKKICVLKGYNSKQVGPVADKCAAAFRSCKTKSGIEKPPAPAPSA